MPDFRSPTSVAPLFSIVTVTLNPGEDLAKTVDSVLMQDFKDWELLIKDGGSTDGTEELHWNDPRIRRHTSADGGIFDAMNQALHLLRGQYVCFLNAGDLFYDKAVLSTVADSIRENPDVPFFYGDVHKPQSRSGFELYPDRLSRYFLFTQMICHQSWFVGRETYLNYGGFETEHPMGGDRRLMLKMLARDRGTYRRVPQVIVSYKGAGASAGVRAREVTADWANALKRRSFKPLEYRLYSLRWAARNTVKRCVYDPLLWRWWRRVRSHRHSQTER